MKVENQKPWLFEINNLDSNKINPFLSDSSYLTIEFKVENFYNNEKLGFLGMPGKNFGISYDFEVETFVFEFWTKGLNGRDNFHCYKDFHINRIDVENGLVLTIHYDKEKNILELYHDFNIFFDVELDDPLIEDYYTQPLYFGCHNPDADNHKHKCFTELDLKHFSIFNGEAQIEEIENFYNNSKNINDKLLCYFDLKEKYLVHKEDYNYFLIQNQKDKLINISLNDLNISVVDRIKLKRKRVPGLKVEHKKPYKLKTKLESNLLTNRDFSLNIIFKVERHFTQDEKIGFFGIPGKNFGISFDYEVEKFVFEYWTQKDVDNKEFHCHKNYKINRNDLHNGITISLIYKKNEYFELYHNFKLIDKIEVKDNLISEYNTEPIYFGCHNPSSLLENHKCFTEMELNHFSVYDGVMDITDLEKLTKTDNSLTYFNFKKTDNIDEIFDNLNKETSIELVDLLTFKTMVDFNLVKEKLNKVGCGFCLAKWTQVTMHLHNGTTHSCHHPEPHKIELDEIKRNPTALHNSNVKKRARKEMLENKRPSECNYCWNVEDHSDSFSDRFFKSAEPWSEPHFDEIANLHWRDNYNPKYVEVNFSNTCNFKCAYCGPEYSTKWMEEINEHGGYMLDTHEFNGLRRMEERNTKPYKQTDENPYVEAFWEWFPELYSTLDTFRITGGEPLLSKDTWKVLDFILETDTPNENLKLSINSNLGVSDELIDKLILKLEKIIAEGRVKEVILFTSCEGYGKQAEYTRFGLEFDRLFSNIDKILTVLDKVTIVVMSTFNMFSIFSYEKLIKKIHSFKLKHFNTSRYWNSAVILDTSYLRHPSFMSFRVLKDYIDVEYFNRWLKYMKFNSTYRSINFYEQQTIEDVGFSTQEIEKISRIKDIFITDYDTDIKEFDSSKRDFIKFIDEYEKRRGVNCEEYYPELINFIKQIRNDNKL